jgi:integrase
VGEGIENPEVLPPAVGPEAEPGAISVSRPGEGVAMGNLRVGDPLYEAAQQVAASIRAAKSPATRRAYASDWRHFEQWCRRNGLVFLPATPQTVALYIGYLAKPDDGEKPRTVATITRRLSAINMAHKAARHAPPAKMDDPLLAETFHGTCRRLGKKQKAKLPLTLDKIVQLLGAVDGPIAGTRDQALLLVGFVGALRRSELAAIRVEDLVPHRKGYTIRIPRSKTDQEGQGREVDLLLGAHDRTCPVLALENWLKVANIKEGPVFRHVGLYGNVLGGLSGDAVGRIVKRLVSRAKLDDPAEYGGHSLRAGFVTEASANGASDRQIMRQTGHKSRAMIDRYSRAEQRDRQSAVSKLGV